MCHFGERRVTEDGDEEMCVGNDRWVNRDAWRETLIHAMRRSPHRTYRETPRLTRRELESLSSGFTMPKHVREDPDLRAAWNHDMSK